MDDVQPFVPQLLGGLLAPFGVASGKYNVRLCSSELAAGFEAGYRGYPR